MALHNCPRTGYDVYYGLSIPTIEPHCCRAFGCNGGIPLDEACEIVAKWYDEQAKAWRDKTHADVQYFI